MPEGAAMYEIEVKGQLKITTDAAMEHLKQNDFVFGEAQFQDDIVFARSLTDITEPREGASVARVRTEDGRSTLNVKTYTDTALTKIEHETAVESSDEAVALLESLGLKEIIRIQKWRQIGSCNNLTVCLDNVINLGAFIEFELLHDEHPNMSAQDELYKTAERLLPGQFTRLFAGYDEIALARKNIHDTPHKEVFAASSPHSTNKYGDFTVFVTDREGSHGQDIVLMKGDVNGASRVLCRITSRCIMSTALDADDCDCAKQTALALSMIQDHGSGVLIYLDQEGRGHGLPTKIKAMRLKHSGYDTFSAFEAMDLRPDITDYGHVQELLTAIGVRSIALVSNNPDKAEALVAAGVVIEAIVPCAPRDVPRAALRHLEAKRKRGHTLDRFGESDAF
jgi:predicted adenylyl cyclase CyaB